jgi:hypothetical protein
VGRQHLALRLLLLLLLAQYCLLLLLLLLRLLRLLLGELGVQEAPQQLSAAGQRRLQLH